MDTTQLTNAVVRAAIETMSARDREGWLKLFAHDATLTDDGTERGVIEWSDSELFGSDRAYLKSIDWLEDGGLTIYGKFHSDRWGEFDTFMRFQLHGDWITRLDVGQA